MLTLFYGLGNAEFKIFPVVIPPDPCFRGEVEEAKLHLLVILSGYTAQVGPHQLLCPRAPTNLNPALHALGVYDLEFQDQTL